MFENVFSIPIALLFLSFLIFVHELAHFLAGKLVGIHADVFSIGFGPALFRIQRGRTEYRISAIPAGGYVKFPGEYASDDDGRLEGEFHQAPVWKRMIVVVAGPLSNLVLGVVMFGLLAAYGIPEKSRPAIGEVMDATDQVGTYWDDPGFRSPAATAGFQPGDTVLSVNGRDVESWEQFTQEVMIRPNEEITIRVLRNGETTDLQVTPRPVLRGKMTIGQIGVAQKQPLILGPEDDREGSPLEIVSLDGKPVHGFGIVRRLAEQEDGQTVPLKLRDGTTRLVTLRTKVIGAPMKQDPSTSPALGLEPGDRLTAVNGEPITGLNDVRQALLNAPSTPVSLSFEGSDGTVKEIPVEPALTVNVIHLDPSMKAVGTLRLGDRLLAVNGQSVNAYQAVRETLRDAAEKGTPVRFTFERHTRLLFAKWDSTIEVETPVIFSNGHVSVPGLSLRSNFAANRMFLPLGGLTLGEQTELIDANTGESLAIHYAQPVLKRYGPIGSIGKGTEMTTNAVTQTLSFLNRLIAGDVSVRYVSGPVGIVSVTQKTLTRGGWSWDTFLSIFYLTAFISVNLAVVNLLPIPIADGGQLLFFALEQVRGRPLAVRWQVANQQVSVLVLLGIFALVTLKDLVYW